MFQDEVTPETPLDRAEKLRSSGNALFKKGKHMDAIVCYSEAISICPPDNVDQLAMLYQNRAAAQEVLVSITFKKFGYFHRCSRCST